MSVDEICEKYGIKNYTIDKFVIIEEELEE
jgi:hypothetical protein